MSFKFILSPVYENLLELNQNHAGKIKFNQGYALARFILWVKLL